MSNCQFLISTDTHVYLKMGADFSGEIPQIPLTLFSSLQDMILREYQRFGKQFGWKEPIFSSDEEANIHFIKLYNEYSLFNAYILPQRYIKVKISDLKPEIKNLLNF